MSDTPAEGLARSHAMDLPSCPRVDADDSASLVVVVVATGKDGLAELARRVERRARVVAVASLEGARRALDDEERVVAVILDLHEDGEPHVARVRGARAVAGALPLLVVSRVADRALPEHARLVEASYVAGPSAMDGVERFVERAVIARGGEEAWTRAAAHWLAAHWGFSPREEEILHHLARGVSRKALPATLGTAPGTVRTQVTSMLRKSGLPDVSALARHVRAHARATFSHP